MMRNRELALQQLAAAVEATEVAAKQGQSTSAWAAVAQAHALMAIAYTLIDIETDLRLLDRG